MLKKTREYLIHELHETINKITESQKELDEMKAEIDKYETFKTLKNAYNDYSNAKFGINSKIIMDLILCVVLVAICLLFYLSKPIIIIASCLFGGEILFTVNDIIKYQKAKRVYDDLVKKSDIITPDTDMVFKFDLNLQKELEKNEEEAINNNKKYLQALWDILSSDDFVNRLEHYSNGCLSEEIKEALTQEWYAYLEEIEKVDPNQIHFVSPLSSEDCSKDVSLSLKKIRGHHTLAIYQTNDTIR